MAVSFVAANDAVLGITVTGHTGEYNHHGDATHETTSEGCGWHPAR